jgi:hypothetical protein
VAVGATAAAFKLCPCYKLLEAVGQLREGATNTHAISVGARALRHKIHLPMSHRHTYQKFGTSPVIFSLILRC